MRRSNINRKAERDKQEINVSARSERVGETEFVLICDTFNVLICVIVT